jgi:LmbE family N-acetylglucosaminyl deacetylase
MFAGTADAQIVVFAPHPDDEALFAGGIVYQAVQSGQPVKVVMATNGDCKDPSLAHQRQNETIAAMGVLGLAPSDVIFLGYPDCGLRQIYYNYTAVTSEYTSVAGRSRTYGFEGLGSTDYHTYIYGSPAKYNKPDMLQDIRTVLLNYRPQDIYVTSGYDEHSDHHTLNFFVVDAVTALTRENPSFQATVHEAIVHEPCEMICDPSYHWPMPDFTPTQAFEEPPFLFMTPRLWSDVESVPVPPALQSTNPATNPKNVAIDRYVTQANTWLHSFVKFDEIFWKSELWANLALTAAPTTSSVIFNGMATTDRINDGSVSGSSQKPDGEWISNSQLAGAWAQLTWPTAQTITRIVLHDRTDEGQNVTSGSLIFSDGTSIPVGALPPNGAGLTLNFAAKSVTWVRFTALTATGTAVGLSEFEVYGPPAFKLPPFVPSPNSAPFITAGPTAAPLSISDATTSTLSATASDPDSDALTYVWTPAQGSINGSGASVVFTPPQVLAATTIRVNLVVADGRGGRASGFIDVTVTPSGQPVNVARFATATASTQTTIQPANRAIDGIVNGYPYDVDKEWASNGQLAGAWIQLTWSAVQSVSRVVLHDRVNLQDQILGGTLRFSDGSTIPVGILPNDGAGLATSFATKTVTWVRFEVTSARGNSAGLAEFEAIAPPPAGSNNAPQITSGPTATPTVITDIDRSTITAAATDPDGDAIGYSWQASGGTLSSTSGASVTFTPPRVTSPTAFRIDLVVNDDRGGAVASFVTVNVTPSGSPLNLAPYATVTASTENSGRSQEAVKAVDGYVDGYPGDSTREWSTVYQGAGAWIQLTWPSAQTIFRVNLHDRINTEDQIVSGLLRFSDGSTVAVGTLPNNGAAQRIDFASRSVTWIRLEITQIRGGATGLAEFEAYATPPPGSNPPPQITSGPTANPATITDLQTSTISVTASDPAGEPLTYSWLASGGTLSGSGTSVTFRPPRISANTTYRVTVEVTDDTGYAVTSFVDVNVTPSGAPLNLAQYGAVVTASSENSSRGQQANNVIDGLIDGYPGDPTAEWSTTGQLAGAWVQLTWPTAQSVYRVVLHDRINPDDQVLAGTLRFSDGSTIAVGSLPNNGADLVITFASRSVTFVRFEITGARGSSTGLAEMEVFATPAPGSNAPPQITLGPTANPAAMTDTQTSAISVTATDLEGDPLTYAWRVSAGTITGSGAAVTFTPPRIASTTTYRVFVDVTDSFGATVTGFVDVSVTPSGVPTSIAALAAVTASSENESRGQTAVKVIDGVIDGFPGDRTREWVAPGQLAGAWIQLTWSSAQTISRVVLYDRINLEDQIRGATLRFSNGTTIALGALPNDGAPFTVDFASQSVTWVRLEITNARGSSTGLAEFQVF